MRVAQAISPEHATPKTSGVLDLTHLVRQTLGDSALEREILQLFMRQSTTLLQGIEHPSSHERQLVAAHTLKGAARALLRDRPFAALTVGAVMEQAGLARTVFYRHFDDLADLAPELLPDSDE